MEKERWAKMTPEEKRAHRFERWLNPGVTFVSDDAEKTYRARVTRLIDAICLEKTPDRVPVSTLMGFFPAWRAGMTPYDAMHDMKRASEAWFQHNMEFQQDVMVSPAINSVPGDALDIIDLKHYSWPGHGVAKEAGYQFHEAENMTAEEYDDLIRDPTYFLFRKALPRFVGSLSGMRHLTSPLDMKHLVLTPGYVVGWNHPEVKESVGRMMEAGRLMAAWLDDLIDLHVRLTAEGFIDLWPSLAEAPFDVIGDAFRGTRGILTDMYYHPDKLIAACDRVADVVIESVLEKATPETIPGVFMPLHKGLDGFMSPQQFEKFYWPSLRKVCLALIDEGFVPFLFTEGHYDTRFQFLRDLPRGKAVVMINTSDIVLAKKILGDVACIQGNVPVSMVHAGTPEQMTAYCRHLFETAGEGGGFILDFGAGADSGRAETLHAMIDSAAKYGVYR